MQLIKETEPNLRCRDLLSLSLFTDAVVLAGEEGLHRPIERINVMEVPDVIDWVKPGEFLMTTGYPFKDHPEALIELIPQLVAKGVAALGIKTKRYLEHVPAQALKAANLYHFPIIELPPATVFSDVVREVMERVLFYEVQQVSILQDRIQAITSVLLDGGSLEALLKRLEELVCNPVILLDSSNRLILSPATARSFGEDLQKASWSELRYFSGMGSGFLKLGGRQIRVLVTAIPGKRRQNSLLILLEANQEAIPLDSLTLDRASTIAGLELVNIEARREVESKYIDQFIQDWLMGRFLHSIDLQIRAEACGCRNITERSYAVGIVRFHSAEIQEPSFLEQLRRAVQVEGGELYTAYLEDEAILVIPDKGAVQENRAEDPYASRLIQLIRRITNQEQVSLCLGKTVENPTQLHLSYQEARQIKHISQVCSLDQPVLTYDHLGVYLLLSLVPECKEKHTFLQKYLQPILDYDEKHESRLLETLIVYFAANRNMKTTAERLFTHYNTVIYRLERISQVLGMNLEDPEITLQLQLAIKLEQMK